MTSSTEDFDKLLESIKNDSSLIDKLTDAEVTELRKKINPYGRTIEGSGKFTCLSITNLADQYMKRFHMTSLIGFLYRQCDEYLLDDGEPPVLMDNYEEYMAKYEQLSKLVAAGENDTKGGGTRSAEALSHKKNVERFQNLKKRIIVRQFIDHLFQYNPDKHVRSAYSHNPLDPERETPDQVVRTDKKTIISRTGEKKVISATSGLAGSAGLAEQNTRTNNVHVNHIPPADTFHRWSYYEDVNYEEIRQAVQDLYCEKPDLEFAINPYDQFKDAADAEKFVQKHKEEVIADILTLHNGKWNLCGSFKKNRDRINFYNERTAIIEEIFKQNEQDKKLGADLMRKRVSRKKADNIKEAGPDHKELVDYKKESAESLKKLGAEDITESLGNVDGTTTDAKDTKEAAPVFTFKNHEDTPYDSVQVDVYDFSQGGIQVNKTEFFTEAEAPKAPVAPIMKE
jgi:hypothetical protein